MKERGWLVIKFHGGPLQMAGIPDLLVIKDGRAYWLEVKVEGGKVSKLQEHWLGKLKRAGCTTGVVRSVWEAEFLLCDATPHHADEFAPQR